MKRDDRWRRRVMEGHDQGHCSDDQDHTCQGKPFLTGAISGFANPIHLYCKRKSIGKSSDSVRILNTLYACGSRYQPFPF
jgi:hypothetical protein